MDKIGKILAKSMVSVIIMSILLVTNLLSASAHYTMGEAYEGAQMGSEIEKLSLDIVAEPPIMSKAVSEQLHLILVQVKAPRFRFPILYQALLQKSLIFPLH